MRVITAADAEGRLDWLALSDALAEGHLGAKAELGDQFLTRGGDTLLSRAAWIDGQGVAVKSVTVLPGNPAQGLPSVNGAMLLFEDRTGQLEAVIDSELVTKWKTAGDSLLGARLLARKDAGRLLIVGAGAVARSLVAAYRAGFPGIAVTIWNRSEDKAWALADEFGLEPAGDLATAVPRADIVACCTMARTPVLRGEWLRPGQHVDLIGAFTADMREADDAALRRARIFVDSRDTTLDHIGELKIPLAEGAIGRADVLGDLYDLVAGGAGRESDTEITLFKNGGGAHLDLMTGRYILSALATP
ncbi:ornithine cyclodeaminase [Rhodobacteraceae bacterium 2CG4]|uniref:Ornithine cyclodeaminase n=1 Tax=Halovulum marinum TaxID=2662447 RepID=A0A6L5Z686_9RHOB|nr:NAD(P)-binding domain-containing protein [Halovulum marinum]MSU91957.1 ornithine cyclodeaminase [Halovulum marinum]